MNDQPLVSIIVLSYQHGDFIGECIESIIGQTYRHIEIIICDDGSTDNSKDIIRQNAALDSRIIPILNECNKGIHFVLNTLLTRSSGEYICVYDGDDKMYPTKIEKQVRVLENNPEYSMCFHNVDVYDSDRQAFLYQWLDKYRPTRDANDSLFISNWFFKKDIRRTPSASKFGRADYIKNCYLDLRSLGWIEVSFYLGMHVSDPNTKWYTIPEVLGLYRLHDHNVSRGNKEWTRSAEEVVVCYGIAATKFPEYAKKLRNEEAFWWFNQLLYDQIPSVSRKYFYKEFYRRFGLMKFAYLKICEMILSKKLYKTRQQLKNIIKRFVPQPIR